jgi:hypothetical protein
MTGLDPVIFIGWLLIGIAAFAIGYGQPMAGSSPAMTGVKPSRDGVEPRHDGWADLGQHIPVV